MGVHIKLGDEDLPLSFAFLDFLGHVIQGAPFHSNWQDQLSEGLSFHEEEIASRAKAAASDLLSHSIGKAAAMKTYRLVVALLTGKTGMLEAYHRRYHFVFVVGAPRHGGSYLIKQLYRALGMDTQTVPDSIAHDGFPDARPFTFSENSNSFSLMMRATAEYLVMLDLFFEKAPLRNNRVVVPKKATKFAYQGSFFNSVFGPEADYLLTLRHPVPACISTYEKSGGFPVDGQFSVRSRIEDWMQISMGSMGRAEVPRGYFDAYLHYWEHYHMNLALGGLLANRRGRVVVYGKERMMAVANGFYTAFGSHLTAEEFHVFDKRDRHKAWQKKAAAALQRVHAIWRWAGLPFPLDELMEQW